MAASIKCENAYCGKTFELPSEPSGQGVTCPFCQTPQTVYAERIAAQQLTPSASAAPTKSCPHCGQQILAVAKKCRYCGKYLVGGALNFETGSVNPDELRLEYKTLQRQRRIDSMLSIVLGLPGMILLGVAQALDSNPQDPAGPTLTAIMALAGVGLFAAGMAFVAKHRGRNPAWGLVGLLSCPGLLFLLVIKDFNARRMTEIKSALEALGQRVDP